MGQLGLYYTVGMMCTSLYETLDFSISYVVTLKVSLKTFPNPQNNFIIHKSLVIFCLVCNQMSDTLSTNINPEIILICGVVNRSHIHVLQLTTVYYTLTSLVGGVNCVPFFNPRHACAARVTVVTLSVCLSVPSKSHLLDVQEWK